MSAQWPNPPDGTSLVAQFLKRLLARCMMGEIVEGPGYRLQQTAKGTILDLRPAAGSTPKQTATLQAFTLVSVQANFITATNDSTGVSTLLAKPPKLRNSILAQTIDGVPYTYAYNSTVERTAMTTGYTEFQRVVERYLAGDKIYGMQASATGVVDANGVAIPWIDINVDGREWAARADQSGP